jgi:branched-subunit amino acid aminotransferase/4-amino-4-deoxychorismate lyase
MMSQSQLYGKAVFTTISIIDGQPFLLDKHFRRLFANSRKIGLQVLGHSIEYISASLSDHLVSNKVTNGKARITLLDETESNIWSLGGSIEQETRLQILTGERRGIAKNFLLTNSPFPTNSRSPLAGIKSCNYLEPIMSLDEAKARGFHEAIRVNEHGFVTSACMANVFWVKGGKLFTPGLTTGCLAGTTREFVLENIDCREVEVGIEALHNAEAIFLTSAGIGVAQVAEFEGRRLGKVDHPILNLLPY